MNNPSKEWLIDHAEEVLREIGIKEDEIILDFGCGSISTNLAITDNEWDRG